MGKGNYLGVILLPNVTNCHAMEPFSSRLLVPKIHRSAKVINIKTNFGFALYFLEYRRAIGALFDSRLNIKTEADAAFHK